MTDYNLYCVYRIVNTVNGKCYIGQTNNLKRRWKDHRVKLKNGTSNSTALQRAVDKYGIGAFELHVVESDIPECEINEREQFWITVFNSQNLGYNLTAGGADRGYKGVACIWNGIRYSSITEAARVIGIDAASMHNRIRRGYSCDEDIASPNKPCTWNSVEYPSITEAAKANGISIGAMGKRIHKRYKSKSDMVYNRKKVSWNGVLYPSVTQAAKALGISPSSMGERIRKGYACDEDMRFSARKCTWNGICYESISLAAAENNISTSAMSKRLECGYTCDDDVKRGKEQ